jgi:hypothetical protein
MSENLPIMREIQDIDHDFPISKGEVSSQVLICDIYWREKLYPTAIKLVLFALIPRRERHNGMVWSKCLLPRLMWDISIVPMRIRHYTMARVTDKRWAPEIMAVLVAIKG